MPRKRKVNLVAIVEENDENTSVQNTRPDFLIDPQCKKLIEIVLEAQKNDSYHEKCCKQLLKLFDKFQHNTFVAIALHCMKLALVLEEENDYGNSQLRFWARALTSFDSSEDTHPVLADILNWLLDTISADSHVRFRMCFFVNALLNAMGPEAQLDDNICNNIQTYMIERMRDTNQNVRLQAVYALQRLQNPDDNEDKVIQVYMFHIDNDPSPKVRQAIITAVAKNKKTIPYIIGRLWDSDEKVRRHTILHMSKYPVRSYMVAQRLKILEQSLKDQSPLVKNALMKIMLPQWIESYQKNYIQFLTGLKIDATEEELKSFKRVSTDALMEIFKKYSLADTINSLNLNETEPLEKCIPPEDLNVENVVLWQAIIIYLKETDDNELENILPDLSTMAEYLLKYIELNQSKNEPSSDRYDRMYFQFVIETLLQIINGYDFGDEVGRNKLKDVLFDVLKNVHIDECVIKILIKILENLITDSDERLHQIVELVRNICDNNQNFDFEQVKRIVNSFLENSPDINLETQIRQKTLKILELREQESIQMNSKDYTAAHELSSEIENTIEEYKSIVKPILTSITDESIASLSSSLYQRKRLSSDTVIKCIQIFFYTVASDRVKKLIPSTVELYKKLICINFESQDTNLRKWALRSGTSCAILYEALSKEVFDALWKQFVNTGSVKIWRTTIQCMFELLDPYGFDHFDLEKEQNKNKRGRQLFSAANEDDEIDEQESAGNFMNFMAHLTDNCEDATIRSVITHGYCRLILRGHLSSSEIVVKLLLKYFNPATENDLSQCLGVFFENLIEYKKQELLQQALLPTINAILEAPMDSPLSEIDPKAVIRFVIQSTRMIFCAPGLCIHNTLAMSFISAIKEIDEENNKDLIRLLVGELHNLEISDDTTLRNGIKKCIEELQEKLIDPKTVKCLQEFIILLEGKSIISFSSSRTSPIGNRVTIENGSDHEVNEDPEFDEGSNPTNDEDVFKVPAAKPMPDFMSHTDHISDATGSSEVPLSPETRTNSLSILDTPVREIDTEINITPFVVPASQETPKLARSEKKSQENSPKSTDEEIPGSPISHQTVWSKTRKRGIKLTHKLLHESNTSLSSQDSTVETSPQRKVLRTPDLDSLKRFTRSAAGINRPSLKKVQILEQKRNTTNIDTTTNLKPLRSRVSKTPQTEESNVSQTKKSEKRSTKINEAHVTKSPTTLVANRPTRSNTPRSRYTVDEKKKTRAIRASSSSDSSEDEQTIALSSSSTPTARRRNAASTAVATSKTQTKLNTTAEVKMEEYQAAKTPKSVPSKKRSTKVSDVLPQSQLRLIRTRSLASRSLRNRSKNNSLS